MRLRFIGSGDAFGTGGRLNTCFHVEAATTGFLIDCGASSLIGLRRFGVDPNGIDAVFVSHLHGDHFGGLPFLVLDAQLVSRRSKPLVVAGPPGLRERLTQAMEALFPGSSKVERRFALEVVELEPEERQEIGAVAVTPFIVRHPSGAPPFALRLEVDGRTLAYTGDTEWVEALVAACREADLMIAEASFVEPKGRFHLDLATLLEHLPAIRAKRVILTHMGRQMIDHPVPPGLEKAEDGLSLEL